MTARRSAALSAALAALLSACGSEDLTAPDANVTAVGQGLGATLSTTFTGATLGGATVQGDAKVEMFPPATLQVRVRNVNLPDGSLLDVSLAGYPLGTVRIARREGAASLPVGFQVGINSALALRAGDLTVATTTWH